MQEKDVEFEMTRQPLFIYPRFPNPHTPIYFLRFTAIPVNLFSAGATAD